MKKWEKVNKLSKDKIIENEDLFKIFQSPLWLKKLWR